MKNFKKLVILILVIAMSMALITIASAKPKQPEAPVLNEAVRQLQDLGILKGEGSDGLTDQYVKSKLTRIQGFVIYLRLTNNAAEAEQFIYEPGDDNFSDHQGKSEYVRNLMAYAKANPGLKWVGSNGKFNPLAHLTAKEFAKVLLVALGYKDIAWKDVENTAQVVGLTIPKGEFTLEKMAEMTVQALSLKIKGTDTTLRASLNGTVADTTPPAVSDVVLSAPGQVTVYFSEAMKLSTLTTLANYVVDLSKTDILPAAALSDPTFLGAKAEPSADRHSVKLTIPGGALKGGEAPADDITTIVIKDLTDLAGNLINPNPTLPIFVKTASSLSLDSLALPAAVETKKLQVTFNNRMQTIDPKEFRLYGSDGATVISGKSYVLDATGKTVTITLGKDLTATAKVLETDLTAAKLAIVGKNTKDIFGNTVTGAVAVTPATVLILDKIAPTILSAETQDTNLNGKLDAVKITFSESVNDITVNPLEFTVEGYSSLVLSTGTANDSVIYLTFAEALIPNTAAQPKISYTQGTLADMSSSGNKLASTGEIVTADKAAPAVVTPLHTGVMTAPATAELVFSEDLTYYARGNVQAAILGAATGGIPVFNWTSNSRLTVSVNAIPGSLSLAPATAIISDAGNTATVNLIVA